MSIIPSLDISNNNYYYIKNISIMHLNDYKNLKIKKIDGYIFGSSCVVNNGIKNTICTNLFDLGLNIINCGCSSNTLINMYYSIIYTKISENQFIIINYNIPLTVPGVRDSRCKYSTFNLNKTREINLYKYILYLLSTKYKIICYFCDSIIRSVDIPFIYKIQLNDDEYLDDLYHPNEKGCKRIAESIYYLYENNKFIENKNIQVDINQGKIDFIKYQSIHNKVTSSLWENKKEVIKKKKDYRVYLNSIKVNGRSGFILMAANPPTKGHIYIIEEALKYVDKLFIQLNNSDSMLYTYIKRKQMLEMSIKQHRDRVIILEREGGLVDNKIKFGNYFIKSELNNIDHIDELISFKEFVTSVYEIYMEPLGITDFFVGEETNDLVTKKLVEDKISYFSSKGINCHLIPRQKNISATNCRQLIKEKRWEELELYMCKDAIEILKTNI